MNPKPNTAAPRSPGSLDPPPCAGCGRTARFVRVPHRTGTGWQVRAWCVRCACDATPSRVWWPKRLLSASQLAELADLTALEPALTDEQLELPR
jgi:hypothetical protein